MTTRRDITPPRLAERALERLLPAEIREAFLGDLDEEFRARCAAGARAGAARLWYWRETLAAPIAIARMRSAHDPHRTPGDGPMTNLWNDLRFAVRMLARQPGFTAVVAITLALGIGATTAIFSAVYPVVFAPLPYPGADRVAMVWEMQRDGSTSNVGYPTAVDIGTQTRSLASYAAMSLWLPILTTAGEPELLQGSHVSAGYFRTLGVMPALGRDFTAEEDVRGRERVVILSHALWRTRFGADSAIIGRTITLDGIPFTVVGVMPADFTDLVSPAARLWTTLRYDLSLPYACRDCRHLRMVARVAPAVPFAQASADVHAQFKRIQDAEPATYRNEGIALMPLREQVLAGQQTALVAVLAAVALVLLIACANVTNLLLARASQRQGEFAVRTALGAGRSRMVRQLLTESMLVAAIGGVLGVMIAVAGARAISALAPSALPRVHDIAVDAPVLAFAIAVTTLVGIGFGLAPALRVGRTDLHSQLQQGSRRTTAGRHRTRAALVIGEMAIALVLLVGSGLMVRSMQRLFAVSPGFQSNGLLTLQVQTGGPKYRSDTATWVFFDRVLAGVRAVPGVEEAGMTSQLPLSGDFDAYGVHMRSTDDPNMEKAPDAFRYGVSPGYLEAMRIPLRRGRAFTDADRAGQAPVVLVGESFARRRWPDRDPIGEQLKLGDTAGVWRTVVGVVGDVRQTSLTTEVPNSIYVPETQWYFADGAMSFAVRTRGDPAALAPALRRAIWAIDKDQPIVRVATMPMVVAGTEDARRFVMVLFLAFAGVALALAAAGIYGVISGAVVERTREVGIRAALGASRGEILAMVVRQGLTMAGAGVAIGIVAALALSRLVAALLYAVPAIDPVTYLAVAVLLVGVAALACWVPAWRAARLDPAVVLRSE